VQYQGPQFDIIGDAQPQRPRSRTRGWAAKLNIFFYDTTSEGKPLRRAQELRLERAHIPVFTIFWTLMHVLDERSPLYGYDAARAIERDARVFVTLEARDPKEHGPMPTRFIPSSEMHRNWCGQDVTTK
jgi:hypothetical protein